jgi:NAD(P)-dependent dehydrogenase (short-subunit alcohol dehydrogenase family)
MALTERVRRYAKAAERQDRRATHYPPRRPPVPVSPDRRFSPEEPGLSSRHDATNALSSMPGAVIEALDLMDPASIDAFADRFVASKQALHILVNNAGIMANPLTRDSRGYESQFATNHLGTSRSRYGSGPPCARQQARAWSPCPRSGTGEAGLISTIRTSTGATMIAG